MPPLRQSMGRVRPVALFLLPPGGANWAKPVFNYSFNFGVDTRTKNIELTNAIETGGNV